MRIGFAYNLKEVADDPTETHAEYETPDTIDALHRSLSRFGDVVDLPCIPGIASRLIAAAPDVVFNIAEGWGGRNRESFIPAFCEMLAIPCTGSDATSLGISMDKGLQKRIVRDLGIPTPDFVVYESVPDVFPSFGFPVFVKPCWDGSSRGIYADARAETPAALAAAVERILMEYDQPAIVEPYLDGAEYCVGLLGNAPPRILPTCEVHLGHEDGIPYFSREYKRRDRDRLGFRPSLDPALCTRMEEHSLAIWDALGFRDYARFDFRCNTDGVPQFLEVNALPGMSPVSGIFVHQAEAAGIAFDDLVGIIISRTVASRRIE